jgi:hypothetical protein
MAESLTQFLERVVSTDLLSTDLVELANRGATEAELELTPQLPEELRTLLAWRNGFDLDVLRIHGVVRAGRRIERIDGAIIFASDPAGYLYALQPDGAVISIDREGGYQKRVANGIDDFLRGFVFGKRAAEFAGVDWAREVASAIGAE